MISGQHEGHAHWVWHQWKLCHPWLSHSIMKANAAHTKSQGIKHSSQNARAIALSQDEDSDRSLPQWDMQLLPTEWNIFLMLWGLVAIQSCRMQRWFPRWIILSATSCFVRSYVYWNGQRREIATQDLYDAHRAGVELNVDFTLWFDHLLENPRSCFNRNLNWRKKLQWQGTDKKEKGKEGNRGRKIWGSQCVCRQQANVIHQKFSVQVPRRR